MRTPTLRELSLFFVAILPAVCNASTYRLPIYRTEVIIDLRFAPESQGLSFPGPRGHEFYPTRDSRSDGNQLILTKSLPQSFQTRFNPILTGHPRFLHKLVSKHTSDGLIYFLVYTTDIQVGSPPQPFRAQVDLSWGDFFIASLNCTYGCTDHNLYDSSQSSTYIPDFTPARVLHSGGNTWGYVSQDSLWVGGLEVRNQRFEEVTRWNAILYDELLDGALGLARTAINYSEANVSAAYPLQNMAAQGLLDRNLFSLILSPSRSETGGELVFGAIDHHAYIDELMPISISHVTGGDDEIFNALSTSGWQLPVKHFSIGSKDPTLGPFSTPFPNHTAIFSTTFPYIIFPQNIVRVSDITRRLGVPDGADDFGAISCDERPSLPNLTISLGDDTREIVLTPWDYLYEVENLDGSGTLCALPFQEDLVQKEGNPDYVILGTSFLGGLYSVFDADKETISCKAMNLRLHCSQLLTS